RVERDERGCGLLLGGQGQLTHEGEAVVGGQFDVLAARRKNRCSPDLHVGAPDLQIPAVRMPMPTRLEVGAVAEHAVGAPRHEVGRSGFDRPRAAGAGIALLAAPLTDGLYVP